MSKKIFYPDQDLNDIIESENEAFYKGGVGSGVKGHSTPQSRLSERLSAQGIPKEKHHLYSDKKYRRETSIGVDALGNDLRPGEEKHRAYAGQPQTRDHKAQEKRREELKNKK